MKRFLIALLIGIFILNTSCNTKEKDPNATIEVFETYSELQTLIDDNEDGVTVLNFWSTTCAPCIKEMPHFNELETAYQSEGLKIILVNLEKTKRLDSHIYPFVKKHKINPEVVVLTDQNYRIWTDNIDTSWYGALPATLILKGDKRNFRFGSYETYEDLKADVDKVMLQ
ncbi:TlpA family protein disulfide reductase [Maribacter sp. HTCC2170]|uniref:TlpA family protein disulfide reductase n=1 Tax=Maribacter sp. (strain HTCC2170 / KCCM 42371) TaxID=313603 RepID=UPI00006B47F0|nr:TlpA disulfide reductase family protein [Maribacter sp. HTCC2170]EAR01966.1 thioredoxin-related transmembrane protein [Maribacter sp. HTCC2170]